MIYTVSYSQQYTKFRIDDKQKKELLKNGDTNILMIEIYLDDNERNINTGRSSLSDPNNYIVSAKKKSESNPKLYKNICLECYKAEYNFQRDRVSGIIEQRLPLPEENSFGERKKTFALENQKRDSIYNSKFKEIKEKPYDRFILAMDMLGKKNGISYGNFTIFTNMDEELARTRFSLYLQNNGYTYGTDSKQINKPNFIQEYYIPKTALNNEVNNYIEIKYYYSVHNELPSYYTTTLDGEFPCWLIDKVIIEGTTGVIINIYVNYWLQSRKTIDSDKTGEIAKHTFMGDYISLQRIGLNKCRIEITKQGGDGMNYYTSYKILERYNELK